ncbi:oxaloacetate decarboxylase alpha subunit [Natronocella acetinitrilica]|uniref:Oxaloacetate decarboxylase alpha subunit n=1 Tax=Natronocella acetinitrilica TaxID=414046 RepID=A0AAE3G3B9_9GAMM|nr:pyruvate carboxylase subunit B [Natronocella acetinitrilica]MCP1673633.1 oxaloacetate decarboxylase alpha subunit [Natronocella acetinitrilica]
MAAPKTIRLIDVTLRDAHQCLWATRMTTAMMKPIAENLDNAGFEAIDLVGGAVFDVAVRFLREDPWERMRILNQWVKKTPLILHHRGQSLFTFKYFPDDVVALTAERMAANGIRYHTTYDALNDTRNLEVPIKAAKAAGIYTVAGFVYTVSPVHTDEYYVQRIKEMIALGADAIFLKDPSGLLTPERAMTLVPAARKACGKLPLQIHTHCLSGLAPYVLLRCAEYGADVLHTATSTLANGASHPATESVVRNLHHCGFNTEIDLAQIEEAADKLRYIAWKEGKPVGEINEYDEFHYQHQVPGGMISNLKSQLAEMGMSDRLDELLEEAARVREELGYPILVSPFAQYIATQAFLNVTGKERYGAVADEIRQYVLGYFGKVAGPIDPNLFDRITRGKEAVTGRTGDYVAPQVEEWRKRYGPFKSDDDLLLSIFYNEQTYGALKAAGPIDTRYAMGDSPAGALAQGISDRPWIRSFSLQSSG